MFTVIRIVLEENEQNGIQKYTERISDSADNHRTFTARKILLFRIRIPWKGGFQMSEK